MNRKVNKINTSVEGNENERIFIPNSPSMTLPIAITRFGITNPDKNYRVKRKASTVYIIEYVASGSGFLRVNGKKYVLSAGDAYIIHLGDECEYYADKNDPYKKYWINFQPNFFFNEMLRAYGVSERVFPALDLSAGFKKILELQDSSVFNDDIYIPVSRIIFDMIMDMAEYTERKKENSHEDLAAMIQLKLRQSISKNVTVENIAREFYRTPNDIIYRFKRKYGITPYAYLIDLRINTAKELLTNTDKSIKEIADYLCFFSEYHFSNTFKKKIGVSPSNYRKL